MTEEVEGGDTNTLFAYQHSDQRIFFITGGADKSLAHLLPDVFCLMVRIFRLMLVLFYIYIYINSTNIPPFMIIDRIYENQNLLSL